MNLIKQKREEKKLSQSELGRLLGLSQQHVQRFENGYPVPIKHAPKLAEILDIDIKELLPNALKDYAPTEKEVVKIDILNVRACCGNGFENITENVIGQHMMTLPALRELTTSLPENIKIIKAIGESMIPTIYPNDVVWIDISVKTPTSDGLYVLCVGTDLMIKRIQINPFDSSATVKSDNPQYTPFTRPHFQDVNVIGRVIYHMKRMS
ncbi:MAG: helix-turn-helix domain-containing protein [Alphaproteobacteria bacterium]|nr:helix-turn-helix domain-containing protein [Alphaproteobacteria bacterium]